MIGWPTRRLIVGTNPHPGGPGERKTICGLSCARKARGTARSQIPIAAFMDRFRRGYVPVTACWPDWFRATFVFLAIVKGWERPSPL